MRGTRALLAGAVAVAACAGLPPPSAPAPAPATRACLDPVADGRARLGGSTEIVLEPLADPLDLDGDGRPDVVLRSPGGGASTHLLYLTAPGTCPRFAGRIDAFMLGCHESAGDKPCDLWVDTWLAHGDRLRSRWRFDGAAYQRIGDGEVVPGPRKPPRP